MKVRATKDGVCKYYRTAGDVFDWPEGENAPEPPFGPDGWVERVDDDTPHKMQEAGEKGIAFECMNCGYITQRRTRFCPDCGSSAEAEKDAERIEKERADAIEAIQGKASRPPRKVKPKLVAPGVVDKDKEI